MSNPEGKQNFNGFTTDPLQRLASMKPPRDLSLGGVKPNKKIFTPNLNVTRNKNKGPQTTNSREEKKVDRNKKDRNHDQNRFAKKNESRYIKSGGVFSEGLGVTERQTSRVSYGRNSDSTSSLHKAKIKVKDMAKIENEMEDVKNKKAFGLDDLNEEECEDFSQMLDVEAPVKLPMGDGGSSVKTLKKQKVVIKREPSEDCATPFVEECVSDVNDVFEDTSVVNLLKSDKPTLILLQLPDTLPGCGRGTDDDRRRKQDEPSTSSEEQRPENTKCVLKDLEEGKIGVMRVHRSGRVTMMLGDTLFEVCSGTKTSFHQEVVSVATNDESRSANLVSLGPLQHKLNVTPDWEALFEKMTS